MSDRIAVMYRGRLVAIVDGRTADKYEIGLLMATGGHEPAAPAGPATDPTGPAADPTASTGGPPA